MSPASPSLPSSDSRLKWRKRKRESNLKQPQKHQEDEEEEEDELDAAAAEDDGEGDGFNGSPGNPHPDPVLDLREAEVLSDGGTRISDFPAVFRRAVNRPHPSVLALVAADRHGTPLGAPCGTPSIENISHGQLQALSTVLPDHPSLQTPADADKPSSFVCTPPPLLGGKGVAKQFGNDRVLLVPMHSDWFSEHNVHRLERQVVPHYFSGKSPDHTPEKYMSLRNKIIAKYLENPARKLSYTDCQSLITSSERFDLGRMVRFLEHWGIINYLASTSDHCKLRSAGSLLREEANGELQLQPMPLKAVDSLILFEKPKYSNKVEDLASMALSSASMDADSVGDLDGRIRERLAEHACSCCTRPLSHLYYQSQKEVDIFFCSDCFHDGKFIVGHSSVDFLRVDCDKDMPDADGDNWTDQETFLLLEALEKYNDDWNAIEEHVGTKSKDQCILHFIRLPMEDGLLESIELPKTTGLVDVPNGHTNGLPCSTSNGNAAGTHVQDLCSESQLPFANSQNPVMSLVAFLTSAIGPRVAASCASASLSILTKGDYRPGSESMHVEHGSYGTHANSSQEKGGAVENQVPYNNNDASSPISLNRMKSAAMCGLSSAAMKAKLFADQEEREIQRLAATIINHQLKRLELKLKQFAEVETLLLKECEQVERTRQRLAAERVRLMSTRFLAVGGSVPPAAGATQSGSVAAGNPNPRQSVMPSSIGQANMSPSAYANNLPAHPQMPFTQRQQQMFSFGPRLPLSAIHPSPSVVPSQNMMFTSGMTNASNPNHHPLLRPSSGNKTNIG